MNVYIRGKMDIDSKPREVYFRYYTTTNKGFYRTLKGKKWHKITLQQAIRNGITINKDDDVPSLQRSLRNTAQCAKCKQIVESRFRHGFVACKCEAIFVDGGNDYWRAGGNIEDFIRLYELQDLPKGCFVGTDPKYYMKVF